MDVGFIPTTSADEAALQLGVGSLGAALLRAVASEPATGVTIISSRMRLVYANVQSMQIFLGEHATPDKYVGRYTHDFMPLMWVRERLRYYDIANKTGKPFLLRVIWQDHQHFTWHYPLHGKDDHGEPLFITITRRISSEVDGDELTPSQGFDQYESSSMNLTSLDVLSARELEVLALLGQGLSAGEVAGKLGLSEKTVENHRASIYTKLDISDRASMIAVARRAGLSLADGSRQRLQLE